MARTSKKALKISAKEEEAVEAEAQSSAEPEAEQESPSGVQPEASSEAPSDRETPVENAEPGKTQETVEAPVREEVGSQKPTVWASEPPRRSGKKLLVLVGIFLVLGGLVVGGVFSLRSRGEKEVESLPVVEVTPSPAEEGPGDISQVTPTATPAAEVVEIDLQDYSVQVLNGSGVPGEAGRAEDLLLAGGFEAIDVGNADSYDYTDTEVSLREGTPKAVFDSIEEVLGESYSVVKGDALARDADYDVVVVVGVQKE